MMFWADGGTGFWGYTLMTISMVLFWALIIYGVVMATRVLGRENQPAAPVRRTPEQILAERFAHGEIDEQQYHQHLAALRTPTPAVH